MSFSLDLGVELIKELFITNIIFARLSAGKEFYQQEKASLVVNEEKIRWKKGGRKRC